MVACFPVYGAAILIPQGATFWEAFSVEVDADITKLTVIILISSPAQIFHASDSEMEEHALEALKALLQTIYSDEQGKEELTNDKSASVAWKMCDACLLELNDADKSNAAPATRILARALAASGKISLYGSSQ